MSSGDPAPPAISDVRGRERQMLVDAEVLRIAYEERGPREGVPVLLLHGWPDDARTWDRVAESLTGRGYRTIAPFLRGFGETRFRDSSTERSAETTALARDAVELLDELGIERAVVAGHDWGARTGYVMAALWPERIDRLVAISVEYQTGIAPGSKLDYEQQRAFWYQWFFASERGREALVDNRRGLCRELWRMWSPTWSFDAPTFEATAAAWDNPDWVDVTLHYYRVRWGHAPVTPRYADLEARMRKHPKIAVPTVHLHGDADGCILPSSLRDQSASFSGGYRREIVPGAGHFIPRERPEAIVTAVTGAAPAA
jgi:pimeloyl-ACP methyl ester carboxylesterase